MAMSIGPRSMACFLSFLAFTIAVTAQDAGPSVTPSNSTLPASETNPSLVLQVVAPAGPLANGGMIFSVVPLTTAVGLGSTASQVVAMNIRGDLVSIDTTNANTLDGSQVAFISCDPNGSNIDASAVIGTAGNNKPKAIVLYSLVAQSCSLNGSYTYSSLFSMVKQSDSRLLRNTVGTPTLSARIGPNSTSTASAASPTSSQDVGGPTPTTAVAMSILYSITGIITLLFLIIIATGAIRAHRHPERYGPRTGFAGRPRQSRAKGLARAMLETIPIVKFGDPEPAKPAQSEIELEDGQSHRTTTGTEAIADGHTHTPVASGIGGAEAGSVHSETPAATQEEHLGCSICTEDFTTGEDVRVLPCNHKYHPGCVDPWLLNVSGTCPLCRHDLRPVTSRTSNTEPNSPTVPTSVEGSDLPPPLMAAEAGSEHTSDQHRNRISRFLDLSRLRHAPPDERIAALRQLREQSQLEGQGEEVEDNTEERSRRARLTGRLRDKFRIKTRSGSNDA